MSSRAKHARSLPPNDAGALSVAEGLSFEPLPALDKPSTEYETQMQQLRELRDAVQVELARIAQAVREGRVSKQSGNPWESPVKRALSARTELARMDYMESPAVAALLYRHSHFATHEDEDRAALERTAAWREAEHVLSLYDYLRRNLVIRTGTRMPAWRSLMSLALAFAFTIAYIPLFALSIVLCAGPLMDVWTSLGVRNHFYPVDMVQKLYARGFLALCGVQVRWHGVRDNVRLDRSTIGLFSHASNLDPFVVASGPLAFKWIGKKTLFRIPVIGWLLTGLKHVAIDRSDRVKAVQSLQKAAEQIVRHKRCIAISPEGTRSRTGRLADFKKGAFHTAMQVGVPLTPLLVAGAYDLWPTGAMFARPGVVHVYVLPPIDIAKGDTYNSLASKVRREFLNTNLRLAQEQARAEGMSIPGEAPPTKQAQLQQEEPSPNYHMVLAAFFLPLAYLVLFGIPWGAKKAVGL